MPICLKSDFMFVQVGSSQKQQRNGILRHTKPQERVFLNGSCNSYLDFKEQIKINAGCKLGKNLNWQFRTTRSRAKSFK